MIGFPQEQTGQPMDMKIAIFGLGEAGRTIGSDIATAAGANDGVTGNVEIHAYDPADVPTPQGITRVSDPVDAVSGCQLVMALTGSVDAKTAIQQALPAIPEDAVYADFASSSAGLKRELAAIADARNIRFCDVALMAMVPGNGVRTPSMFAGNGATTLQQYLAPFGMPIDVVSDKAGDAAERKLLRSVVIKGLAGLLIESLQGAHKAGCPEWLWNNLVDEFSAMDKTMLERLITGTQTHAERRFHEMKASQQQLEELGIEPLMTTSTVSNLQQVLNTGVPEVPDIP